MLRGLVFIVCCAASSASLGGGPAATVSAGDKSGPIAQPPVHWWAAKAIAGNEGSASAIQCKADELAFVSQRGTVSIRPASLRRSSAQRWEWTLNMGAPEIGCVLEREPSLLRAKLTCSDGVRREVFSLERISDSARSAELDALLRKGRPSKDVCKIAEVCGVKAFALVAPGTQFNPDEQLGNPRIPEYCQRSLEGLRSILREMKKESPKECLPEYP